MYEDRMFNNVRISLIKNKYKFQKIVVQEKVNTVVFGNENKIVYFMSKFKSPAFYITKLAKFITTRYEIEKINNSFLF